MGKRHQVGLEGGMGQQSPDKDQGYKGKGELHGQG